MAAPPRFMQSVYDKYPDNERVKDIYLMAYGPTYSGGDRHVLLGWDNSDSEPSDSISEKSERVIQIVQLTGQPGNYAYYSPVAQGISRETWLKNQVFVLGSFTCAQRNQILHLASKVVFRRKSTVNSCRTWTRDLLSAMVEAGLVTRDKFEEVDKGVPLLKRLPEAEN